MVFKKIERLSEYSDSKVCPVFSVIEEVIYGLDQDNRWVKITPNGKDEFKNDGYDASILTLLEYSYSDLREKIINILTEQGINSSLIGFFPFMQVIMSGMRSGSEYWMKLAMKWLKSDASLISGEVVNFLTIVSSSKNYSQEIRHAAMRILKTKF